MGGLKGSLPLMKFFLPPQCKGCDDSLSSETREGKDAGFSEVLLSSAFEEMYGVSQESRDCRMQWDYPQCLPLIHATELSSFNFMTGCFCVTQSGLELAILLHQPSEYWDYRCEPPQ